VAGSAEPDRSDPRGPGHDGGWWRRRRERRREQRARRREERTRRREERRMAERNIPKGPGICKAPRCWAKANPGSEYCGFHGRL
jgi:hypothetical protein